MLDARIERWPIAGSFTISRGAKTEAVTVVAEVRHGDRVGRGECVPYPRYGETPEATLAALTSMQEAVARGLDRQALQAAMPAGAARSDTVPRPTAAAATDIVKALRMVIPPSEPAAAERFCAAMIIPLSRIPSTLPDAHSSLVQAP